MSSLPFQYTIGQRVWYSKASPLVTTSWLITSREYYEDDDQQVVSYGIRPATHPQAMVTWAEEDDLTAVSEGSKP